MANFNPTHFLDNFLLQLRNLGVDMTPILSASNNTIARCTKNPKPCYKIQCFGYMGQKWLPDYSLTAYVYPDELKIYIDSNHLCGVFFPHLGGYTPAENTLKNHGLLGVDNKTEYQVEFI